MPENYRNHGRTNSNPDPQDENINVHRSSVRGEGNEGKLKAVQDSAKGDPQPSNEPEGLSFIRAEAQPRQLTVYHTSINVRGDISGFIHIHCSLR
jgi:hypothetical protein